MAFNFDESLSTNLDLVRFYTSDTVADQSLLSDELIAGVLARHDDDYKQATIACVNYMIRRLNQPRTKADWLEIDPGRSIEFWLKLRDDLEEDFGVNVIYADSLTTYREDSAQTEPPDYSDGRPPGTPNSLIDRGYHP